MKTRGSLNIYFLLILVDCGYAIQKGKLSLGLSIYVSSYINLNTVTYDYQGIAIVTCSKNIFFINAAEST